MFVFWHETLTRYAVSCQYFSRHATYKDATHCVPQNGLLISLSGRTRHFTQKWDVNTTRTVNSSRRPSNIINDIIHFAASE